MRLAENLTKTADEQLKNLDIWKLIGEEWGKMTDTDKKPWNDQFLVEQAAWRKVLDSALK
jgi:hypothetical protein